MAYTTNGIPRNGRGSDGEDTASRRQIIELLQATTARAGNMRPVTSGSWVEGAANAASEMLQASMTKRLLDKYANAAKATDPKRDYMARLLAQGGSEPNYSAGNHPSPGASDDTGADDDIPVFNDLVNPRGAVDPGPAPPSAQPSAIQKGLSAVTLGLYEPDVKQTPERQAWEQKRNAFLDSRDRAADPRKALAEVAGGLDPTTGINWETGRQHDSGIVRELQGGETGPDGKPTEFMLSNPRNDPALAEYNAKQAGLSKMGSLANAAPVEMTAALLKKATDAPAEPDVINVFDNETGKSFGKKKADAAALMNLYPERYAVGGSLSQTAPRSPEDLALIKARTAAANAQATSANAAAASKASGEIDDDTINRMAEQYATGDKSVFQGLGRGTQGASNLAKLNKRVTGLLTERGFGGADQAAKNAEFKGVESAMRTAGTRGANMDIAANEVDSFAGQALEASKSVNRVNFVPFNKIENELRAGNSNPDYGRFIVANQSLINAYAQVMARNGTPTVSGAEHARGILSAATSQADYEARVDQIKKETAAAKAAPAQVRKTLRDAVTGREDVPASTPTAADVPDYMTKYGLKAK